MKRTIFIILIAVFVASICRAQNQKGYVDTAMIPAPQQHYLPEFTFDKPSDPAAWSALQPGWHTPFGSTEELYRRCAVPVLNAESRVWEKTGGRGQRLNAQSSVWSRDPIEQIRF